jgi:hypothetical protein
MLCVSVPAINNPYQKDSLHREADQSDKGQEKNYPEQFEGFVPKDS